MRADPLWANNEIFMFYGMKMSEIAIKKTEKTMKRCDNSIK